MSNYRVLKKYWWEKSADKLRKEKEDHALKPAYVLNNAEDVVYLSLS